MTASLFESIWVRVVVHLRVFGILKKKKNVWSVIGSDGHYIAALMNPVWIVSPATLYLLKLKTAPSEWLRVCLSQLKLEKPQWKLNPHIYNSTSHCNEGKIPHNYKPQMSLLLQCNLQIEGFSGREIHAFSLVCCRVIQQLSRPWLLFSQLKWIQWLYNKLPIWENNTDTWLHRGLQQHARWYQNTIKRIQPKNKSEGRSFNFYEEEKTRADGH